MLQGNTNSSNVDTKLDMNVGLNSGPSTLSNTLNDVAIFVKSVHVMHGRFSNTVYGFFLGKRVAYPSVENYRVIDSEKVEIGCEHYEGGRVLYPVWVKFHDIPIIAFTEDGLSAIATKLDTPMMLDSYTSAMFMDSWGRSSYARVMVELRADVELKDTLLVDVPKFVSETYTISTIHVEYERTPPRCSSCKVFGLVLDECPKKIVSDVLKNSKSPRQDVEGVYVGLKLGSKVQFKLTKQVYQHVSKRMVLALVLDTNGGNSKLAENEANSDVVSSIQGTSSEAFVDDPLNADSASEGDEVFNKTDDYTESTSSKVNKSGSGLGNKNLYEQLKDTYNKDPYNDDDFDDCGLTDTQMKFANSFDICLRGQIR
ncbi:retrotransposon protein, putative, ty1-copia subclass [Tanacetum coccineum]